MSILPLKTRQGVGQLRLLMASDKCSNINTILKDTPQTLSCKHRSKHNDEEKRQKWASNTEMSLPKRTFLK